MSLAPTAASAADKAGSQDDPALQRYEGSSIIGYLKKNFDELTIPLSPITSYDYTHLQPVVAKKIAPQGEVTRLVYLVPKGPSALEVFANYKQALAAGGFKPLFESGGSQLGIGQTGFFGDDSEVNSCQLFGYSPDKSHYIAAEANQNGQKIDVSLYVTEYQDGLTCGNTVEKGQVILQLALVKSGAMQSKMVTVSASDIQKGIDSQGHIAIYGIYFDTNKTDLKPESKPSLDQVAMYLKQNPGMKIHVVGHTDNVGTLDFNLKLSRARAASVVAALVRDYGVPAARLNPAGVASLAPVAPNTTEDGRAKNRRVELIPQ
jgi:outer membrane protein OmpA-like peptidoglycan-associated protein